MALSIKQYQKYFKSKSVFLLMPQQGRRQRMLNAGAEGVLDQWQGELGN